MYENPLTYSNFWSLLLICILGGIATGCGNEPDTEAPSSVAVVQAPTETILTSNIDHLRIRKTPGPDGEVLSTLSQGDTLLDLGEISAFTTEVTLRGIRFDEPWIKVRTQDSLSGWVYAGALNFQLDDKVALTNRLMNIRLQTFFGEMLTQRILDYRTAYRKARTSAEFETVYQEALQLRDTLVQLFEKRITFIQKPDQVPDISWMEQALPGMITQRVAEGTAFYLFLDYRQWLARSRQTKGSEDDQFVEICLTAFALDSIEYFAPDWVIQTSDVDFYSELGKGVHRKMFEKINEAQVSSEHFSEAYRAFKTRLLEDIEGTGGLAYWNDQQTILLELDAILEADFGLLTRAEKTALQMRREQFLEPDTHNIRLNMRAGME